MRDSQFNLAYLYERGGGVPRDLESAYKWYSVAAENGDKESKTRARIIEDQLNAADRAAAKKAAANFHVTPFNRNANVNPAAGDL